MVWCSCPLPNLPWLTSNLTQWSPPAPLTSLWSYLSVVESSSPFPSALLSLHFSEVQLRLWSYRKALWGFHADYQSSHLIPKRDQTSSNPCTSSPESLHPSLYDPKSPNKAAQTKPTKPNPLMKAPRSSQHHHHCLCLLTLINTFNLPLSLSPLPLSLSVALSPPSLVHMLRQHSNDFIYSMKSFRGGIKRTYTERD